MMLEGIDVATRRDLAAAEERLDLRFQYVDQMVDSRVRTAITQLRSDRLDTFMKWYLIVLGVAAWTVLVVSITVRLAR